MVLFITRGDHCRLERSISNGVDVPLYFTKLISYMKLSLRLKLIISFLIVIITIGLVTTLFGTHLIGEGIIKQAQDKVRVDLNSAREIYQGELNDIQSVIRLTAERFFIKDALVKNDLAKLNAELKEIREKESLDALNLINEAGIIIVRSRNPTLTGESKLNNTLVKQVLSDKQVIVSTEIITREELVKEGQDLAERAYLKLIPTPKAKPTDRTEETSGMILKATASILDDEGGLLGVLCGYRLINRNYKIVDKIKETVYQGHVYKHRDTGTATIFQGDLRVSTNVRTQQGDRAIGTRVSEEVYNQVLVKGERWIERAFVVNDWYITAYEPIRDINNAIIGILYVGTLERPFVDMRRETVWLFLGITIVGVLFAFIGSYLLANNITRPVRSLAAAAQKLAAGDMDQHVALKSEDEIGQFVKTFNVMIDAIKERDEKLKAETQQALIHMEKMSSLGQMAAGVAHEINNPLSGVLTYIQLLLKNLRAKKIIKPEDLAKKLDTMEKETSRCTRIIKSLLTFARQSQPSLRQIDSTHIIDNSLVILAHQAELSNVKIVKEFTSGLPKIDGDADQLQQVFTNLILNAVDAMSKGGTLIISTQLEQDEIAIKFQDTGAGIAQANLKKLFTPFFTTKEKGKGIGLGLAVCYGIIQRHNGKIDVSSELGKGTTFTIRLRIKQ